MTKLATAVAVLVAAEEGIVDLDEPAGPPGSTVRHLLAHASGLPFEGERAGGRTRDDAHLLEQRLRGARRARRRAAPRCRLPTYFEEVWGFPLDGSPARGVDAPLAPGRGRARVARAGADRRETLAEACRVQFPGLGGVLPGFGRMEPNDWGLGWSSATPSAPHWTGTRNSPATFGHFGGSGTFLWVDPEAGLAVCCLTDLDIR